MRGALSVASGVGRVVREFGDRGDVRCITYAGGAYLMVEGHLGLPGAGKTFNLVRECVRRRKREPNLRVYANMTIDLPGRGEFIKLTSWEELLDAEDGLVVIDEINLWMPSRAWAKLPGPLLWKWAQVRKSGLDIIWSAQHQARVDKLVRELTFMLYQWFSWKKLGFFVAKAYLGEVRQELFASWAFSTFDLSIAKRYDTFEEVSLPEYLAGALQKDMIASRGKAPKKSEVSDVLAQYLKLQELVHTLREVVMKDGSKDAGQELVAYCARLDELEVEIARVAGAPTVVS